MIEPNKRVVDTIPSTVQENTAPAVKEDANFPGSGIALRYLSNQQRCPIWGVAWSNDGSMLVSQSSKLVQVHYYKEKRVEDIMEADDGEEIRCIAWSKDDKMLAIAFDDLIVVMTTPGFKFGFICKGHNKDINELAFSPDGTMLASSSNDGTVRIWDTATGWEKILAGEYSRPAMGLYWAPDGKRLYATIRDGSLLVWDLPQWKPSYAVGPVSVSGEIAIHGRTVAFTSAQNKACISVWDLEEQKCIVNLEGHTGDITGLTFSSDGALLFSKSMDGSVRIYRCDTWKLTGTFPETASHLRTIKIAFNPKYTLLATRDKNDTVVRISEINYNLLFHNAATAQSVLYTTAKLVLVGDSGVGKTTLGWRLAFKSFKEHPSTHGQQFWVINELGAVLKNDTVGEAVLWDFAGQPDYRLVHSLFMNNVNLALLFYDSAGRQDSFNNSLYWLSHLKKQNDACTIILVGGRCDRGMPDIRQEDILALCKKYNITGGFIPTSSRTGEGIDMLIDRIQSLIPWDKLAPISTTETFKRIKEFTLSLKENAIADSPLLTPGDLMKLLQREHPDWSFSYDEMMTAVNNLETHGYVKKLSDSKGESHILLAPDLLVNLASSFVLEARRNQRGLGVLEETKLLNGDYSFPELTALSPTDRAILLDATMVLFLDCAVCFRESFNDETFLVFPALINEIRPYIEEIELVEDTSYTVKGATENVYSSMVVLLGYTNVFSRTNQWQNQAQYQVEEGVICGFRQVSNTDGSTEFILHYTPNVPPYIKFLFQGLFERFLNRKGLTVSRYKPVVCEHCDEKLDRNVMIRKLEENKKFCHCNGCGKAVILAERELLTFKPDLKFEMQSEIVELRKQFELALFKIQAFIRDNNHEEHHPKCFISYAWGDKVHESWVARMAEDLTKAKIDVLYDKWHNIPGTNISTFIDGILAAEFAIVVGTPALKKKYQDPLADSVVAAEQKLINTRLRQPNRYGMHTVIPVLLDGDAASSFTPMLQDIVYCDFLAEENYFYNLVQLIWRLHGLPFDNPALAELQNSVKPRFVKPANGGTSIYVKREGKDG